MNKFSVNESIHHPNFTGQISYPRPKESILDYYYPKFYINVIGQDHYSVLAVYYMRFCVLYDTCYQVILNLDFFH